jgi:hypothetical protein
VIRRLTLRRADGEIYLDRWGIRCGALFGIYLHRMAAPDPGIDLHDHPWPFVSIILRGGYTEEVADSRDACRLAGEAEEAGSPVRSNYTRIWPAGSVHRLRLNECHRIVALRRCPTWTLVLLGRTERSWGFYEPAGWVHAYNDNGGSQSIRRPLFAESDRGRT